MHTPHAILFDLDGTLLDTAPEFAHCMNTMLAEARLIPITVEALRPAVSFGAVGMLELGFGLSRDDDAFADLKKRFLDLYHAGLGSLTQYFPGIEAVLAHLAQANLPWGIVTNKPTCFTLPLVKQFPALARAACVISGDTLATQKPHPGTILHACAQLQVLPQHCWYIGDAKTDVEASHAAGMRCAVAEYGYIPPHENVQHWGADVLLQNASSIVKNLFA